MVADFEELGLSVDYECATVDSYDDTISFSRKITSAKKYKNSLLLWFGSGTGGDEDPDFEIPRGQNLVRVSKEPILDWIVSIEGETSSSTHHQQLFFVSDSRIITLANRNRRKYFHEVDPETGAIVDTWPRTQFKIGGKTITFESPVNRVDSHQRRTFIETSGGFHSFSADGTRSWFRRLNKGTEESPRPYSGGPKPVQFHERTVTIRTSTESRGPFYPTFEIDLDSGDIIEGYEQMTPRRANEYLDFDTADGWLPVRTQNSVAVLDDRGDVVWEQSFDEELLDAATAGRVTVVETDAPDDVSSPVSLRGFDADGTRLWERHATTEVTVLPAEDTIHLLVSDTEGVDGEKCTVELDPETGAITAVVSGNESVADKLLE